MKFKFEGNLYSLDEVGKAAGDSNLHIDDYIKEYGLTEEEEEEKDFLNPATPGAVVGGTAAPNTGSTSGSGSSESQKKDVKTNTECPDGYKKDLNGDCVWKMGPKSAGDAGVQYKFSVNSEEVLKYNISLDPLLDPNLSKEDKDREKTNRSNFEFKIDELFYNNNRFTHGDDDFWNIADSLNLGHLSPIQLLTNPEYIEAFKEHVYDGSSLDINDYQRDKAFNRTIENIKQKEYDSDFAFKINKYGDELSDKVLLNERRRAGKTNFIERYKQGDGSNFMAELVINNMDLEEVMKNGEGDSFAKTAQINKLKDNANRIAEENGLISDQPFLFKTSNNGWTRADIDENPIEGNEIRDFSKVMQYYLGFYTDAMASDEDDMTTLFDDDGNGIVSSYERLNGELDLVYSELNDLDKKMNSRHDILYTGTYTAKLQKKGYKLEYLDDKNKVKGYKNVLMRDMVNLVQVQNNSRGVDRDVFTPFYPSSDKTEVVATDFFSHTNNYSEQQLELFGKRDALERMVFANINPAAYQQGSGKELLYSFRSSFMNPLRLKRAKAGVDNRMNLFGEEFSETFGFTNSGNTILQEDLSHNISLLTQLGIPVTDEQLTASKPTNTTATMQALGHVPVMAFEFGFVGGGLGIISKGIGATKWASALRVPTYVTPQGRNITLPVLEKIARKGKWDGVDDLIKEYGFKRSNGTLFHKLQLFSYDAALSEGTLQIVEGDEMTGVGIGFTFADRVTGKLRKLALGSKKYFRKVPTFFKTVAKGGVNFVPGVEVGNALNGMIKDLQGNKGFATFLEENYGDEDAMTQRFITSFWSGAAFSAGNNMRVSTMMPENWVVGKRNALQKKYTTDGTWHMENMSEGDAALYRMYEMELATRRDIQTQGNLYVENQWTNALNKFKKKEKIDIAFKFIRDRTAAPVDLKFIDGKAHMVLNTSKLKDNMMPHEYWHLISKFKLKDKIFARKTLNRVDGSLTKLLNIHGELPDGIKFSDVIKHIYSKNFDGTEKGHLQKYVEKERDYDAEEYFGNTLELLSDPRLRDFIIENGFLVNLKNNFKNMLTDLVANNPKVFDYKLFESIPQRILPDFDNMEGKELINYLLHLSGDAMKGKSISKRLLWLNKYAFDGNDLVEKGEKKGDPHRTVWEYSSFNIALSIKELDRRSNIIQEDVLKWRKNKDDFPLELLDPGKLPKKLNDGSFEGNSASYITHYVTEWVKRKFSKKADGSPRILSKDDIQELVRQTMFHDRGIYGLLKTYDPARNQNFTQMMDQHMDGSFSRFMDIYKDSIFGNRKLDDEAKSESSYDTSYSETKNRIAFNSFLKPDGTRLDLSKVLSEADSIVDKLLAISGKQPEITFMDIAGGPFNFESTAKKPPMKLMQSIKEAFGADTVTRNSTIKANIERIYEMIPNSFDSKSQQSTQVIKGQSIFKEFFDITESRHPKGKDGKDNQPFISYKKELTRDADGNLTPGSQKILDRFAEVLTEGRVDSKHTRLFNVMSQAIQARRATDKLNKMAGEDAVIPNNLKEAAYLSSLFNSIGNLKSVQGTNFASLDIVKALRDKGVNNFDHAQKWLRGFNPLTASPDDIKIKNELAYRLQSSLEKGGEGYGEKLKKYKDGKYSGEWNYWSGGHSRVGWDKKYRIIMDKYMAGTASKYEMRTVADGIERQKTWQKNHADGFLEVMGEIIPVNIYNAAEGVKTSLMSHVLHLRGERLSGTKGDPSPVFGGIKFAEAIKSENKIKIDYKNNNGKNGTQDYRKIIEEGLKALESGKLLFDVADYKKLVDPIIARTDIPPRQKIELINQVYPPEFGENLVAFDKMMGVFYETYLNNSKNPEQRLKREKHLSDQFQMQSSNPYSVRAIAEFTSVYIPSRRPNESQPDFEKRLGEFMESKRKGEHMKSSSDFAFESFKDLIEGNYFENYDIRKIDFEQSYGPEGSNETGKKSGWNLVDNFGRNNAQGYLRFLGNHDLMKNTWDTTSPGKIRTMYDIFAERSLVEVFSTRNKISEVNELRLKEIHKKGEISTKYNALDLSGKLNEMLELNKGIAGKARISDRKAKIRGRENKEWNLFSSKASNAELLITKTLGKGKAGDQQFKWWQDNFLKPFTRSDNAINAYEVHLMNDVKSILSSPISKGGPSARKTLNKVNETGYKNMESLRIYMWARQGENIPGLTKTDQKAAVEYIEKNPELVKLANSLSLATKGHGWGKPTENWMDKTIHADVLDIVQKSVRPQIFEQWKINKDQIFSKENFNKLEYLYGENYVTSWKNMLWRMETGLSRREGMGKTENVVNNYITGGQSTIMWWNFGPAFRQLTSMPNYISIKGDNNVFSAMKATANAPQFIKDFKKLYNSDFGKGRRNNLKMNVNEAELATIMQRGGGVNGVLNYMLKQGYTPTRIADSLAISLGGAPMYRNRINTYLKEGMKLKEAEALAMEDWIELSQKNQQSSRADQISYQQASTLGKMILNFANTPMQYNRTIYESYKHLQAGRGDAKIHLSKMMHYSLLQSSLFAGLQQAVFALYTGDPDPEDADKKALEMIHTMASGWMRGFGLGGAVVDMSKNVFMDLYERAQGPKYNRKLGEAAWQVFSISPPISSKVDKLRKSFEILDYDGDQMLRKPLDTDDPFYSATTNFTEGVFNVPLHRAQVLLKNMNSFMDDELSYFNRLFSALGYSEYALLIEEPNPRVPKSKTKNIFDTDNVFKNKNIFKQENIFN